MHCAWLWRTDYSDCSEPVRPTSASSLPQIGLPWASSCSAWSYSISSRMFGWSSTLALINHMSSSSQNGCFDAWACEMLLCVSSLSSYRYYRWVLCVSQLHSLLEPQSYSLPIHALVHLLAHVYPPQQVPDRQRCSTSPSFTVSPSYSWAATSPSSLVWLISIELFVCCLYFFWSDHSHMVTSLSFCRPLCTCSES